jgi:hypothetical protein
MVPAGPLLFSESSLQTKVKTTNQIRSQSLGAGAGLLWNCHVILARLLRLGLAALLACVAALAAGQPAEPEPFDRGAAVNYWTDETGAAAMSQVLAAFQAGQGKPLAPHQILPLGSGRAIWYQVELPPVSAPVRAALTVPVPGIDSVELHRSDGRGGWRVQRSGDVLPVVQWPVRYLYPAFMFTVDPGEPRASTYVRVQHGHPTAADLAISGIADFQEASKAWHLALGAGVGMVLLVLLVSAAHAVAWRDPIHIYYAVHVVLIALAMLALTGMVERHLLRGAARRGPRLAGPVHA